MRAMRGNTAKDGVTVLQYVVYECLNVNKMNRRGSRVSVSVVWWLLLHPIRLSFACRVKTVDDVTWGPHMTRFKV